jgi:hypothetical protein
MAPGLATVTDVAKSKEKPAELRMQLVSWGVVLIMALVVLRWFLTKKPRPLVKEIG